MKDKLKKISLSFFSVFILLTISEISLDFGIRNVSNQYPTWAIIFFRRLYSFSFYRNQLHFSKDCSQYSSDFFYLFRPNINCRHKSIEFDYAIHSNSLGTRDSEENLNNPDVLVIGDSHAMGWGVESNKTFSRILEVKTKLHVLNTGISSFGTVRELLIAKKVNLNKVKYIIFQFDDNDETENTYFLRNGNKYIHPDNAKFDLMSSLTTDQKYFPGRNLYDLFHRFTSDKWDYTGGKTNFEESYIDKSADEILSGFLNVYSQLAPNEFKDKKIIFFHLANEMHRKGNDYILNFSKKLKVVAPKNFIVLDLALKLNNYQNRFLLDNHINENGHKLIAEEILKLNVLK